MKAFVYSARERLLQQAHLLIGERINEQAEDPGWNAEYLEEQLDTAAREYVEALALAKKYPDLIFLGREAPEAGGTDQCSCRVREGAPYPACPHDLRGPEGAVGPDGDDAGRDLCQCYMLDDEGRAGALS